jgi:hypothetical protein
MTTLAILVSSGPLPRHSDKYAFEVKVGRLPRVVGGRSSVTIISRNGNEMTFGFRSCGALRHEDSDFPRRPCPVQSQPQHVFAPLEQLHLEVCIEIRSAVVVARAETGAAVDVLEQRQDRIGTAERLKRVLPRSFWSHREVDLLARRELQTLRFERL